MAINENTDEINSNAQMIEQLDLKIEKLNEKIDEIQMVLFQLKGETIQKKSFSNIVLTSKEQEIFAVIYTKNGELVNYKQLARSLGYSEIDIEKIVNNLIIKGIPLIKRYDENTVYLMLDSEFRNLQAKENLVQIKDSVNRGLKDKI